MVSVDSDVEFLLSTGDSLETWLTALLDQKWQLLTALDQRARKPGPGWKVWVDDRGNGQISAPSGEVLIDRLPPLPDGWRELATRSGSVTVLVTRARLSAEQRPDADAFKQFLRSAVLSPGVAIAEISIGRGATPSTSGTRSNSQVGAELADELGKALRIRARPGAPDRLNSMPEVVPLPTTLELTYAVGPSGTGEGAEFSVLLANLREPDPARAAQLLDSLESAGLPRVSELWSSGLPAPRKGWTHLLWPSQVLILDSSTAGELDAAGKLLFQPIDPARSWYDAIAQHPMNAMGLMVFNHVGPGDISPELLGDLAVGNGMLACFLMGMVTQ